MARIPIGLELYSVREDFAKDAKDTLKAVADMGYEGVEFAGFANKTAEELKGWLDEFGLVCCGSHTGWGALQGDNLAQTVQFNKVLGNRYLIVPGLPGEMTRTRADWQNTAKLFNTLSQTLAAQDMRTGYHNHSAEFKILDGEQPWDTLFGNTDQSVIMQLDMGNAMHGGADVVAILKKYPGRPETVHLKPYSKTHGFSPVIGEDDVPWKDVFSLCETVGGTKWYIVEYEDPSKPALQAVKACLDGLRTMGK